MSKPNDKTYKNRHIIKKKETSSKYVFPNTEKPITQFCTPDEILYELTPIKIAKEDE